MRPPSPRDDGLASVEPGNRHPRSLDVRHRCPRARCWSARSYTLPAIGGALLDGDVPAHLWCQALAPGKSILTLPVRVGDATSIRIVAAIGRCTLDLVIRPIDRGDQGDQDVLITANAGVAGLVHDRPAQGPQVAERSRRARGLAADHGVPASGSTGTSTRGSGAARMARSLASERMGGHRGRANAAVAVGLTRVTLGMFAKSSRSPVAQGRRSAADAHPQIRFNARSTTRRRTPNREGTLQKCAHGSPFAVPPTPSTRDHAEHSARRRSRLAAPCSHALHPEPAIDQRDAWHRGFRPVSSALTATNPS